MNYIYDNGALMLGNIEMVMQEIKEEIRKDIDMCFSDKEDILKDLQELYELDKNMIVCINYENPMGYDINYWYDRDKIKNNTLFLR